MKHQNKFSTGQHKEHAGAEQSAASNAAALQFDTPEELLRHDCNQTAVPPGIARRLSQSIAESASRRPWWRKLLG